MPIPEHDADARYGKDSGGGRQPAHSGAVDKPSPAPMKPIPVRIPATAWGDVSPATAVTPAAVPPIRAKVRLPAGEPRSWRS